MIFTAIYQHAKDLAHYNLHIELQLHSLKLAASSILYNCMTCNVSYLSAIAVITIATIQMRVVQLKLLASYC